MKENVQRPTAPKAQGQKLDTDNLQEVLDAGSNASRVGRQQFFTPIEVAKALMLAMPARGGQPLAETFVDFQMGAGSLLLAANPSVALGVDIDSRLARKPGPEVRSQKSEVSDLISDLRPPTSGTQWNCVNADITKLYPLLQEIDWQFELCGLNPPFSVKWHTERLATLAHSPCINVASSFAHRRKTIDSTLATLLIALDRMTQRGEGYLICNQSTAERLLGAPESDPLIDARYHVWLWLTIPPGVFPNTRDFETAVLYFARDHESANPFHLHASGPDPESIARTLAPIRTQRALLRRGLSIQNQYDFGRNTEQRWRAAKEEYARLTRHSSLVTRHSQYNIWLGRDGKIRRHLTPFQVCSARITRVKIAALDKLQDQMPMALVVQRASRIELLQAVHSDIWRVQPELIAEVERAIAQYHSHRAPFYQLNEVQRLGYLDEHDTIMCRKDFYGNTDLKSVRRTGLKPVFRAGEFYNLTSETISVERQDERPNLLGEPEKVTLSGKELCFRITDSNGLIQKFMPDNARQDLRDLPDSGNQRNPVNPVHSLEDLIRYFRIPEVPDVAMVHPERFQGFVNRIREIEAAMNIAA